MDDDAIFELIFDGEGALELTWEIASQCTEPRPDGSPCYSSDTRQPAWDCTSCGGLGVAYSPPATVRALLQGQSRWKSQHVSGQKPLGEARLTTPLDVRPQWRDDRVRDRFTVPMDVDDVTAGTVFYVTGPPVPFNFGGAQRAWRVQLSSLDQGTRARPQP
jgi:hypothetical protein